MHTREKHFLNRINGLMNIEKWSNVDQNGEPSFSYMVLGGTGGIGSELCRQLSLAGHRVAIAGRNSERVEEICNELDAYPVVIDATDTAGLEEKALEVKAVFGNLHGIANCVGSILLKPAHLTRDDEWEAVIRTNLGSAFATVRSAAKTMKQDGGSVVLVSSAAARIGLPNHEAIAAAKAGIIGLTLSSAASYSSSRIRVNAVAPGLVRTPLTERITSRPASEKASLSMHALGRLGEPKDIASAIAWLLNPDQGWITGQIIGIDGGLADIRLH
jgi:NAD(P)-dependent dehydrogenase (short-subunit alcohol dehydrogenase family)